MSAKPRVVVVGGGFAGLESLFYLKHKLHDKADLTLVSGEPEFLFKPNIIYVPFGESPDKFRIDLRKPLEKQHIEFVQGHVDQIDPANRMVAASGKEVSYDYLVVATGAKMRADEIPGLAEHSNTVWTPDDMLKLRAQIEWAKERADEKQRTRFVFLVPPNNKCSGPLYEMVLMLDTHLRRQKIRESVDLIYATKEESFIEAFGPRLNTVVTDEFRQRNIEGHKGFVVTGVEPNRIAFQNGETLSFDVLVSFPPYIASTAFADLPTDNRNFIHVDHETRRSSWNPFRAA